MELTNVFKNVAGTFKDIIKAFKPANARSLQARNTVFNLGWGAAVGLVLFSPLAAGIAMGGLAAGAAILGGAVAGAVAGMVLAPVPGAPLMLPGAVAGALTGGGLALGLVPGAIAASTALVIGAPMAALIVRGLKQNFPAARRPVIKPSEAIVGASVTLALACGLGIFEHSIKAEANRNFAASRAAAQMTVPAPARIASASITVPRA